jgi:putative transposase
MKKENSFDTIKTKPRQGTSRFYAYASIYLILRNKYYNFDWNTFEKEKQ